MAVALYTRDAERELGELRRIAATEYPRRPTKEYVDSAGVLWSDAVELRRLANDIDAGEIQAVISFEADALSTEFEAMFRFMRAALQKQVPVRIPGAGERDVFAERLKPLSDVIYRGGVKPGNQLRAGKSPHAERVPELRAMRDDGMSIRAIAQATGIPAATVDRLLKNENL